MLVWAPKLFAQIKGKLMQNNIGYLIISFTQICLHVARHLSGTEKCWIKDLTYDMPVSATVACLNISRYCLFKPFHGTSMPKLTTGYSSASVLPFNSVFGMVSWLNLEILYRKSFEKPANKPVTCSLRCRTFCLFLIWWWPYWKCSNLEKSSNENCVMQSYLVKTQTRQSILNQDHYTGQVFAWLLLMKKF